LCDAECHNATRQIREQSRDRPLRFLVYFDAAADELLADFFAASADALEEVACSFGGGTEVSRCGAGLTGAFFSADSGAFIASVASIRSFRNWAYCFSGQKELFVVTTSSCSDSVSMYTGPAEVAEVIGKPSSFATCAPL
jgi:hypothetical protein